MSRNAEVTYSLCPPWYFYVHDAVPPTTVGPNEAARVMDELEGRNLYFIPQNPIKLHPSLDWALGEILTRDEAAVVVLLVPKVWRSILRARVDTIDKGRGCLVLLDSIPDRHAFRSVVSRAGYLLDTAPWKAWTTTLQAAASGVPVVTTGGGGGGGGRGGGSRRASMRHWE